MRFGVVLPIQDVQEPLDVLLDQLRAEVRAADEAGFDAFFLPEFHQTRAGGVISPLLAGAALAGGSGSGRRSCRARSTTRCGWPRTWPC
jgi:alkanesulfonate monooxygenase SsuD/methylene tetrahydromethanopterin reductase-like flavin-dependent oxidoreductase (luciferase family)